jgi:phage tail-like protein
MNGFPYHIVANGEIGAGFKECSDLEAGHVTLSRGALVTPEFFDWVMQHSAARTLKVVQYNEKQEPVANWELDGARVVRVTATTFTGNGFPFRVEELELTVESVTASEKL